MLGVFLTPRRVQPLSAKATAANDEVAAVLRELQLDKSFFLGQLLPETLTKLMPPQPGGGSEPETQAAVPTRELARRASLRKARTKLGILKQQGSKGTQKNDFTDFDIYINEALVPVLAQALDSLCRQLARRWQQGERLDPKVRDRFNPLTWIGQQLLRRHPKCARTPRRQALYRNFKDWADCERGRRELLRRKGVVQKVFGGFMLRNAVQRHTVRNVLDAIDDTLHLEGQLKNNVDVQRALECDDASPTTSMTAPRGGSAAGSFHLSKRKSLFFRNDGWTFEEFWYHFAGAVMKHDVVPYSLIMRGAELQRKAEQERFQWEKRQSEAVEERLRKEAEEQLLTAEYAVLRAQLVADEQLNAIIEDNKILTGDDVRPGDIGYDFEVPPSGPHVQLLAELLVLLGFESAQAQEQKPEPQSAMAVNQRRVSAPTGMFRASASKVSLSGCPDSERYWDATLASSWTVLQQVHHVELLDGVVEREVLRQALVPPDGFIMLKGKVEYELERREERSNDEEEDFDPAMVGAVFATKPTMEQLCQRLGLTMPRLEWLHQLFESFLEPESQEEGSPAPCCLYPDCPASINKEQMRALIAEVEPNLPEAAFEARFQRIDTDGSGLIEFDEFVHWVHADEVKIAGAAAKKMTFEELASHYNEPIELIMYLHSCFQDQLPEGLIDQYPSEPVIGLHRHDAKFLIGILTPRKEDFDAQFDFVDQDSMQRNHCDFDEFLEILDFDDLPAELRDKYEPN